MAMRVVWDTVRNPKSGSGLRGELSSPIPETSYYRTLKRSGRRCEADVLIEIAENEFVWTRCGRTPVEVHHALTRARGGALLDKVGEIYHLIALCHDCHRLADGGEAYEGGVLLDGYVSWDQQQDRPVYTGSDDYLTRTYPK